MQLNQTLLQGAVDFGKRMNRSFIGLLFVIFVMVVYFTGTIYHRGAVRTQELKDDLNGVHSFSIVNDRLKNHQGLLNEDDSPDRISYHYGLSSESDVLLNRMFEVLREESWAAWLKASPESMNHARESLFFQLQVEHSDALPQFKMTSEIANNFDRVDQLIYLIESEVNRELIEHQKNVNLQILLRLLSFVFASIYMFFAVRRLENLFFFHLHALREKEQVLDYKDRSKALLLSSLSEGILEYDLQQKKWLMISDQFQEIFHLDQQAFRDFSSGTLDAWVKLFSKSDRELANNLIENSLKSPNVLEAMIHFHDSNGQDRVIHVILASWSQGVQSGILTFCHKDITEALHKEKSLKESQIREHNSARLASLGEMASGIAHEINNPLAVITARVALLKPKLKRLVNDEAAVVLLKDLDDVEVNGMRIAKIVKGLRTFSRDGDQDEPEDFKVNAMIDDTLGFCMERFKGHGVELDVNHQQTGDCEARGKMIQLSQVLLNLLNNAFDAVKESESPRVSLKTWVDDDKMHILIHDSGEGVSPDIESKIMQPFFTTKGVGVGTGLGLSISQSIIRDHGGRLFLDRSVSSSCFHIEIPFVKSHSALVA